LIQAIGIGDFVQTIIVDEREGEMTHSSTVCVWATNVEAHDLEDNKPTSSRASISLPFGDTDTRAGDEEEEDVFDAEAGWYVPGTVIDLYAATIRATISATFCHGQITLFPVPPITSCKRERNRKKENER
jgi:hypothetical protein